MSNKEVNIPFCKKIHATEEDFSDFQAFVNRVEQDPEVVQAGVVKVKAL
jgi:jmjN domain